MLGRHGLGADRHAGARPRRALRARRATSCRGGGRRRRCCGCGRSCSSGCTSGRRARAEHAKIERVLRGLFDWYCAHPEELPPGSTARGGRPGDRLPGRDDRPLRDPRLDRALRPAGPAGLMARYTNDSRERVRDAVDFAELVGARTELRQAGPAAADRAVPVPRRAHAVVRDRPGREALPLLRLRRGRRRLQVRDGDRGARLHGRRWSRWPSATGWSSSARPRTRRRPCGASARDRLLGAAGAHRGVLRARAVGERRGGGRPRVPARGAGCPRARCASSGSATRRRRGTGC